MASAAAPSRQLWLVLAYRVPGEPARLRAGVWRKLKEAGAVYLANSVAALPGSPAAERLLRRLQYEIVRMGGSAQLLAAETVAGEQDIIRLFNAARDEEYARIITACEGLLGQLEDRAAAGSDTFAELEHGDKELAKLARWNEKVRTVDAFGPSQASAAAAALAKCRDALDRFTANVFRGAEDSRSD